MELTNTSPHRMYEVICDFKFVSEFFFDRHLYIVLLVSVKIECVEKLLKYGADKSLENVWNHQEYCEGDWKRYDRRQGETDKIQLKNEFENDRRKYWVSDFPTCFLNTFDASSDCFESLP